ncbi:MAG: PIN domain-containing protein [Segetibacter sp.]|nr:PIN domain-containing protein [Segetibacter sp.]
MKTLFLDTNIILDLLGERHPFYESAAKLATLADKKNLIMVVSPISFATVSYILSKFESAEIVKEKLRKFKIISEISKIDGDIIEKGLNSKFTDFEDALQYFSAIVSECDILITRNGKDFKASVIPVMSAEEYLKSIV